MFCAHFTRPRYQVSVYRTIGPLVTNVQLFELTVFHPFKRPGHLENWREGALISSPEPKAHG